MALTFDKPLLSGPKTGSDHVSDDGVAVNSTTICAVNGTAKWTLGQTEQVEDFVRDSLSSNSRRAYTSDIERFQKWGGTIPATQEVIASYLAHHASTHASATLVRWLASLAKAHRAMGAPDPTKDELVRSVLRGIKRRYGRPSEQAAPLTREILFEALDALSGDLRGVRDKALLLVGFAGGFRRSELVALEVDDVADRDEGLALMIRRSKTDQTGKGRVIGIPYARGRHCAVHALRSWIDATSINEGAIFRGVDRHGRISPEGLSGQAVSLIIKERLLAAGINPLGFSGHSLRSGFVTSAAKAGVSSWKIREQTGHASDAMLARYIRDSEIFLDNAAGSLL